MRSIARDLATACHRHEAHEDPMTRARRICCRFAANGFSSLGRQGTRSGPVERMGAARPAVAPD
jgi:hypothetical protein